MAKKNAHGCECFLVGCVCAAVKRPTGFGAIGYAPNPFRWHPARFGRDHRIESRVQELSLSSFLSTLFKAEAANAGITLTL